MTASLGRPDLRAGWIAVILGVCLVLGIVTGMDPLIGVVVAAGLVFAAATMIDVTVGLGLFTVVAFLGVLTSGGADLAKVAGLLLFGSWYVSRLARPRIRGNAEVRTPVIVLIGSVGLIAWSSLSALWAVNAGDALSNTSRYLLVILLVPIVVAGARTRRTLLWIMAAFVFGAVVSAVWGFGNPTSAIATGRAGGAIGDPNYQAAVLVAALPIALALFRTLRGRPELQFASLLGAGICLVGTLQTVSRGGLVSLAVILVAGVIFGGRWRASALAMLAVTVVASVGYFAFLASPTAVQHVTSSNTDGRNDLYTVGVRMFKAHPLIGVGSGNFTEAEPSYVDQAGVITRVDLTVARPLVGHDVYLQFLAELGIPGLLLLLAVFGSALAAAYRAVRNFERLGDTDLELAARALLLSLLALMTANIFLSDEFSKQLWLVVGLCLAVNLVSRSGHPRRPAALRFHLGSPELTGGSTRPAPAFPR